MQLTEPAMLSLSSLVGCNRPGTALVKLKVMKQPWKASMGPNVLGRQFPRAARVLRHRANYRAPLEVSLLLFLFLSSLCTRATSKGAPAERNFWFC